ncbi:MAG: DNA/RNA non-specific endonuclease [Bacteroidaceae bacterium]|nr:DNA/RNA non-specific endonuclease [Bacteroidaceae bacterium]
MNRLLVCLFFATLLFSCKEPNYPVSSETRLEIPVTAPGVDTMRLERTGYAVDYNPTWRIPNWVAYELTRKEANGKGKRSGGFEPDPAVGSQSADNSDYKGSGYSRGHMAPAGDMKWDKKAMRESFLLTNICPQDYNLNSGVWEDLESELRHRARQWGKAYIVCGPIVGKNHKTIGQNRVCVPDSFFKVVCWQQDSTWHCKAFVFPNRDVSGSYHDYSTTVDAVESRTGHDFFSLLPDDIEQAIEATDNKGDW